jgi:hypothetical protein
LGKKLGKSLVLKEYKTEELIIDDLEISFILKE